MNELPEPLLLTVAEVARALNVGRTTVYGLMSSGQLGVCRIGRSVRVPVHSVRAYVQMLEMDIPI